MLISICMPSHHVAAQSDPTGISKLGITTDTLDSPWTIDGNPAGIPFSGLESRGRVGVSSNYTSGDFARVQTPDQQFNNSFEAEGDYQFEDWHATGGVSLGLDQQRGVEWSQINQPHAGMPYMWADTSGGDWYGEYIAVNGAIASPEWADRITVGAEVSYEVKQSARRNDPRPLFRDAQMKVNPGVMIRMNSQWYLGMNAFYKRNIEENEVGYHAGRDPFIYVLRGYGTFSRTQIVRGERERTADFLGSSVQNQFEAFEGSILSSVSYTRREHDIRVGVSTPDFGGGYTHDDFRIRFAYEKMGSSFRKFGADMGWKTGRGTDPNFERQNTKDEDLRATFFYEWMDAVTSSSSNYRLALSLTGYQQKIEDQASVNSWEITTVEPALTAEWRGNVISNHDFIVMINGRYRYVAGAQRDFPTVNTAVEAIYEPDYRFLSEHAIQTSLEMGYSVPVSEGSQALEIRFNPALTRGNHPNLDETAWRYQLNGSISWFY